jgi:tRNA nucleotidyltransferase (CCA-adding enzyme)
LLKLAQQIGLNVTALINALQKAQSLNTAEIITGVPAEDRSNGERIRSAINITRLAAITTALSI